MQFFRGFFYSISLFVDQWFSSSSTIIEFRIICHESLSCACVFLSFSPFCVSVWLGWRSPTGLVSAVLMVFSSCSFLFCRDGCFECLSSSYKSQSSKLDSDIRLRREWRSRHMRFVISLQFWHMSLQIVGYKWTNKQN
jgi:hypothetical protein